MTCIPTEVKYHTQNESHFCGSACAMMVLAEIGVAHSQLSQQDLYDLIQNKNNDPNMWGTDPEGLKVTLMAKKGAFPNTFAVFEPETEPAGAQRIVDTLLLYRVSPPRPSTSRCDPGPPPMTTWRCSTKYGWRSTTRSTRQASRSLSTRSSFIARLERIPA